MTRLDRWLARLAGILICCVQGMASLGLVGTLLAPTRLPGWTRPWLGMTPVMAVGLLALAMALLCLLILVTHQPCRWHRERMDDC